MTKPEFELKAAEFNAFLVEAFAHAYESFSTGDNITDALFRYDIMIASTDASEAQKALHRSCLHAADTAVKAGVPLLFAAATYALHLMHMTDKLIEQEIYKQCPNPKGD